MTAPDPRADAREAADYLACPAPTFWRWDAAGRLRDDVLCWDTGPGEPGPTIVFRAELARALDLLAPEGLPDLQALLLLWAALQPGWREAADLAFSRLLRALEGDPGAPRSGGRAGAEPLLPQILATLARVLEALGAVEDLPRPLAAGPAGKAAVAAVVLGEAAPAHPPDRARRVARGVAAGVEPDAAPDLAGGDASSAGRPARRRVTVRPGLRLLVALQAVRDGLEALGPGELARRVEARLRTASAVLPDPVRPGAPSATGAQRPEAEQAAALIEALARDGAPGPGDGGGDLRGVGRLAQALRVALRVPPRLSPERELPLGGYADLSTRGAPERLLASEHAHDDLVFAARMAQGEALYLRREVPPRGRPRDRTLLVDQGVRLWGRGRLVALAAALALAADADRRGRVRAWTRAAEPGPDAGGPTHVAPGAPPGLAHPGIAPVDLTTREGLLALLEATDPSPHPGDLLPALWAAADAGLADARDPGDVVLVTHADAWAELAADPAALAGGGVPAWVRAGCLAAETALRAHVGGFAPGAAPRLGASGLAPGSDPRAGRATPPARGPSPGSRAGGERALLVVTVTRAGALRLLRATPRGTRELARAQLDLDRALRDDARPPRAGADVRPASDAGSPRRPRADPEPAYLALRPPPLRTSVEPQPDRARFHGALGLVVLTPDGRLLRFDHPVRGALELARDLPGAAPPRWLGLEPGPALADPVPGGRAWLLAPAPPAWGPRAAAPPELALHEVALDTGEVRVHRLPGVDPPQAAVETPGALLLCGARRVAVVSRGTGDVVAEGEVPTGATWHRGRIYRGAPGAGWLVAGWDGVALAFDALALPADTVAAWEPGGAPGVVRDRAADRAWRHRAAPAALTSGRASGADAAARPAEQEPFWARAGGPGVWSIDRAGAVRRGDGERVAGLDAPWPRAVHVGPEGDRILVEVMGRDEAVLLGLDAGRASGPYPLATGARREELVGLPEDSRLAALRGRARPVLRRLRAVGFDATGALVVVSRRGRTHLLRAAGPGGEDAPALALEVAQTVRVRDLRPLERVPGRRGPATAGGQRAEPREARWKGGARARLDPARGLLFLLPPEPQTNGPGGVEIALVLAESGCAAWTSDGVVFGPEYFVGDAGAVSAPTARARARRVVDAVRAFGEGLG